MQYKILYKWLGILFISFSLLLAGCQQNPLLKNKEQTQAFLNNTKPPICYPSYATCYQVFSGKNTVEKFQKSCHALAAWLANEANKTQAWGLVKPKDFENAQLYQKFTDPDYEFNR